MVSPRKLLSRNQLASPNQMREATVDVIPNDECKASYVAFGEATDADLTITPTEICAGMPGRRQGFLLRRQRRAAGRARSATARAMCRSAS